MLNREKGFVFTGISLLLAIPAVILMASFISMLEYGDLGTETMIGGDSVFYTCDNLLDFLENGARGGSRAEVLDNAASYADARGITFNSTELNTSLYQISAVFDGKFKCNRTIVLKNGTLNVNLTLSNYATTQSGLPVYLRTGVNSLINTSTRVTFPYGSPADGANHTLVALGNSTTGLTDASGYRNVTMVISHYYTISNPGTYDMEDDCSTKEVLGTQTAKATATMTEYYDGEDSEQYLILGNISNGSAEGFSDRQGGTNTLGLMISLLDEFGYPVSLYEDDGTSDLDCDGNYTAPFPTITATLIEEDIVPPTAPATTVASWTNQVNISEELQGEDNDWDGVFWTNETFAYEPENIYTANVYVSQAGFLPYNWSGEVSFTDLESTTIVYGTAISGSQCDERFGGGGSGNRMNLTITNLGTSSNFIHTIVFKYCNTSAGCTAGNYGAYSLFYSNNYTFPSGKKRGGGWTACTDDMPFILSAGWPILANITQTYATPEEIEYENNFINATV